ncbi:acetylxylan esterase [Nonomuraea sp. NPDC001636]|uniref:alpha/beta hydrolase family protein n=1 Tax=Nonomuraea sp. NPDC001636 TaxID=3154391 RepID=UPI003327E812
MIPGFGPFLDGRFDVAHDLQAHVYRRTERLLSRWEAVNDALSTPAEVRARQEAVRAALTTSLYGDTFPPFALGEPPPEAEHRGSVRFGDLVVERMVLRTAPGVLVPANLWRPAHVPEPAGAVLFVCGHGQQAKAHPAYQAVCARLAGAGLVVLVMDPVGQGERALADRGDGGVSEHTDAGVTCWRAGHSLAAHFVHDARRGLDLLCARPDVDPARLGITGNSGGGVLTALMMALEPRLAAAAPGTFVTSRRAYLWAGQAQDAEQILPGGTLLGVGHEDLLLAMAPRPALVLAADYDFFPVDGTLETVSRAARAYDLLGAPGGLSVARAPVAHGYHPELARAATAFLARHLGGTVVSDAEPEILPAGELACTRQGVFRDHPGTLHVPEPPPAEPASPEQVEAVVRAHREPPAEFFPRWFDRPEASVPVRHVFWRSERDVWNAGVLAGPPDPDGTLVVALFERGTASLPERQDWIKEKLGTGRAVLVLDVRGTGALAPAPVTARPDGAYFGTTYKLMTDLLWLGDSLGAARVHDVLRALAFARHERLGARIELYAEAGQAVHARWAARLDDEVAAVELRDPVDGWESVIPGITG